MTLDQIIELFTMECVAEHVIPVRLQTKLIADMKTLEISKQKMNVGLCKALSRIIDVSTYNINRLENLSEMGGDTDI